MKKTNWDRYYETPYKTASISRRITTSILEKLIKKYVKKNNFSITELGGANSTFFDSINKKFTLTKYIVIDNNKTGLSKFSSKIKHIKNVFLEEKDVLTMTSNTLTDLTFSVGLIEHFDKEGTRKAIKSHFKTVKKNGIIIITFPTPTILYKISRKIAEWLKLWIFHDERPLKIDEIKKVIKESGEILEYKINWAIIFTQMIVVIQKK